MGLRADHRSRFRVNEFLINPLSGGSDSVREIGVLKSGQQTKLGGLVKSYRV